MKIQMTIKRAGNVCCPVCGSLSIVGIGKESCHCGQCGQNLEILETTEILENTKNLESAENSENAENLDNTERKLQPARWEGEPDFEQMSLF